jgi:FkbM family methyltransferase
MIYKHSFKGVEYHTTDVGVANPRWAYDSFTSEYLLRETWWDVKPGDVVFDVGAAYGSFTLCALAAGAALVVAAEPDKEVFYALCNNVNINGPAPGRFVGVPAVVWDRDGCSAGFDAGNNSSVPGPNAHEHRPGVTVDGLCQRMGIHRLDWLKIDVEGMESYVVAGALESIKRYRPRLFIENHPGLVVGGHEAITARLAPLGYKCAEKKGEGVNEHWALWHYPPEHGDIK